MRRPLARSATLALLLAFTSVNVLPQRTTVSLNLSGDGDLFAIGTGRSVSASKPPGVPSELQRVAAKGRAVYFDIEEALSIIEGNHVDSSTGITERAVQGAINGMLASLDPHSTFFGRREFEDLLIEQNSEYFGIGTTIASYGIDGRAGTYILSTFPSSPASVAGLGFGDRIMEVDGRSTEGLGSSDVRDLVRGPIGSIVRLKIERAANGTVEELALRRARVAQPSIPDRYMIREGIGYIDMTEGFTETTSAELRDAVKELKRAGATSLILDLRDNPGGILSQAVKVSEIFLPAGSRILTQRGRHQYDNAEWRSANNSPEMMPLVVIVDGTTASAAEIFAGALQDNDRAVIVGEPTFGKGLVQSVFDLPAGRGLAITTARYFTPSGRSIQRNYFGVDAYDYFTRKSDSAPAQSDQLATTTSGRIVLSGNGIAPDVIIKDKVRNLAESALRDSIFAFVRRLRSHPTGESITNNRHYWFDTRLRDSLISEFIAASKLNPKKLLRLGGGGDRKFLEVSLRHLMATADVGATRANQVLIEADPVVLRSLEALPTARNFVAATRTVGQSHSK